MKESKNEEIEHNTEFDLREIRHFNNLVLERYQLRINQGSEDQIKTVVASLEEIVKRQGNTDKQHDFLWETIRQRIINGSNYALSMLRSEEVQVLYGINRKRLTSEEYLEILKTGTLDIPKLVHNVQSNFLGVALDVYDPERERFTYPYDRLQMKEHLDLVRICANLGHDFSHLPGFNYLVQQLKSILIHPNILKGKTYDAHLDLTFDCLPNLHQGLEWMFVAYKNMVENRYPQQESVDLSQILKITAAESAIRAYSSMLLSFNYNGKEYLQQSNEERLESSLIKSGIIPYQDEFEIKIRIQPGLKLKGNEAGLHLLFYQFLKNSVTLLQLPVNKITQAQICLTANVYHVRGQELIVVRLVDNGPGLDITGILRAKQGLLKDTKSNLSIKEQTIEGDWACLDLKILDIVNFIFERRVSATDRLGSPHSGIGLALAKTIIDDHGGSVWATNLPARYGAKFLILLDPSPNHALKQNLPLLYQTEKVPIELLNEIDQQCDNES